MKLATILLLTIFLISCSTAVTFNDNWKDATYAPN